MSCLLVAGGLAVCAAADESSIAAADLRQQIDDGTAPAIMDVRSPGLPVRRAGTQRRDKAQRLHQTIRQRFSVRAGMLNNSHSPRPDELPGGETSINTTARYTRRPGNRTDGGVARASHRPQVKLKRREYASRTAAGQPRGLRG